MHRGGARKHVIWVKEGAERGSGGRPRKVSTARPCGCGRAARRSACVGGAGSRTKKLDTSGTVSALSRARLLIGLVLNFGRRVHDWGSGFVRGDYRWRWWRVWAFEAFGSDWLVSEWKCEMSLGFKFWLLFLTRDISVEVVVECNVFFVRVLNVFDVKSRVK